MDNIEFNLIDEPWIRVMEDDCRIKEVSLKNAIINSHNYKALSGELPTQDIAVMRLLLAVLHTIFSRADENGESAPLNDDKNDALNRWKALWNKKSFSQKAVNDYFEKWHERFWLFHPDRPFGQVANLSKGTSYPSSKLNGEISQSKNKARIFSVYSGDEKNLLSYSQAARWLLYLNAYDDNSAKPRPRGFGWLGELGLIYIKGNNLFETLMLNLIMINGDKVQSDQKPVWENKTISSEERAEIAIPDNLAELYTLQSRRILLERSNNKVTSYKLIGGDFFQKENAFFEPMTVWKTPKKENESYTPKRHDSSKQMWREFAVLYNEKNNHRAGVIDWYYNHLYGQQMIDTSYMFRSVIVSVEYDGNICYFVKNVFSDSLTMHSSLLSEAGRNWQNNIEQEIKKCDEIASKVADFVQNMYFASGGKKGDSEKNAKSDNMKKDAKEQLYYRLDIPFRKWLRNIDPDNFENMHTVIDDWQKTVKKIAFSYVDEISENASASAFAGQLLTEKDNKKSKLYSVAKARNIFKSCVNKIYS